MNKSLRNKNLSKRPATRAFLAAASLSLSLAAFGCSTDRNLGNGDPVMTPGSRFTPTGGIGSGSESAPSIPPPMTSSSSYSSVSSQARPQVSSRGSRLSHDEAAAIMAAQAPSVRVLGPAAPGAPNRPYASDGVATGQFVNPALRTNPQLTINSSLSSQSVPAISSGAGEAIGGDAQALVADPTTAATGVTLGGIASGVTTTGAAASASNGTAVSPSAAAIPLPVGTFASGTVSPTASAAVTPSATISASPVLAAQRSATMNRASINAARAAATSPGTAATTTAKTTAGTAAGPVSNVRVVVDANGRTVVTNAASARPATGTANRSQ